VDLPDRAQRRDLVLPAGAPAPRAGLPIEEGALVVIEPVEPGEDVRLLLRCIDGLGALEKALVLLYLDGNDHASIAEVLGISVSNVGTKLGRIKQKLRAAFEDARAQGGQHAAR
jgi:RNA polymerase sigma-70 factor (ECF subfamily)